MSRSVAPSCLLVQSGQVAAVSLAMFPGGLVMVFRQEEQYVCNMGYTVNEREGNNVRMRK